MPLRKTNKNNINETERLSLLFANAAVDHQITEDHPTKKKRRMRTAGAPSTMAAATTTATPGSPDNPKTVSTQRTFDSSDDLLSYDTDDDGDVDVIPNSVLEEGQLPSQEQPPVSSPRPHPHKSLWDCQAIHWPPHSPLKIIRAGWKYAQSPYHIVEVVVLAAFLLACYVSPGT